MKRKSFSSKIISCRDGTSFGRACDLEPKYWLTLNKTSPKFEEFGLTIGLAFKDHNRLKKYLTHV